MIQCCSGYSASGYPGVAFAFCRAGSQNRCYLPSSVSHPFRRAWPLYTIIFCASHWWYLHVAGLHYYRRSELVVSSWSLLCHPGLWSYPATKELPMIRLRRSFWPACWGIMNRRSSSHRCPRPRQSQSSRCSDACEMICCASKQIAVCFAFRSGLGLLLLKMESFVGNFCLSWIWPSVRGWFEKYLGGSRCLSRSLAGSRAHPVGSTAIYQWKWAGSECSMHLGGDWYCCAKDAAISYLLAVSTGSNS